MSQKKAANAYIAVFCFYFNIMFNIILPVHFAGLFILFITYLYPFAAIQSVAANKICCVLYLMTITCLSFYWIPRIQSNELMWILSALAEIVS